MLVNEFQILNYKSYRDTGPIQLSAGFNVFIGKNNGGKTALLEALSPSTLINKPHRHSGIPAGEPLSPTSRVELTVIIEPAELRHIFLNTNSIWFPIEADDSDPLGVLSRFLGRPRSFRISVQEGPSVDRVRYPSHGMFGGLETNRSVEFAPTPEHNDFQIKQVVISDQDNCFALIGGFVARSIYTFRAERLALASHLFGDNSVLSPNAENLPVVLNILQGQPEQFARFTSLVRQVFPSIRYVTVQPRGSSLAIMIWNADAPADRTDLAIELSESGTGVGQVLAMLYVVVTSRSPRTILIDEPNIFLHSGAIRKLIEIMRTDPTGHQYVITTHSPDIIRASDAQRVYLVEQKEEQSFIHGINPDEITSFRRTLLEVGTRLSDLFGADNVVWVEGPTEEECFPKIIRAKSITTPPGLAVLAVRATGDFDGRRASAVAIWEIYNRLTTVGTLMPTNIAISLDKEDRSATDMARAKEMSRGLMHFLPRRCFENYLVHPRALAGVLNTLPTFSETVVTEQAVETWLQDHGRDAKYGAREIWDGDLHNEQWLVELKGAVLLSDMFQTLSSAKEEYRKVTHGAALTEWICENDLEHFADLAEYIQELLH